MDALDHLAPISDRYATLPVAEAFTWADCAPRLPAAEWYLVAFRSRRRLGADEERLTAHDDLAHLEAIGAPGFVHYFKGPSAPDGTCLSFCLWASRAEARAAAGRTAHREAVELTHEMYADYRLEFLRVLKREASAALEFEPYDRAPELPAPPASTRRLRQAQVPA